MEACARRSRAVLQPACRSQLARVRDAGQNNPCDPAAVGGGVYDIVQPGLHKQGSDGRAGGREGRPGCPAIGSDLDAVELRSGIDDPGVGTIETDRIDLVGAQAEKSPRVSVVEAAIEALGRPCVQLGRRRHIHGDGMHLQDRQPQGHVVVRSTVLCDLDHANVRRPGQDGRGVVGVDSERGDVAGSIVDRSPRDTPVAALVDAVPPGPGIDRRRRARRRDGKSAERGKAVGCLEVEGGLGLAPRDRDGGGRPHPRGKTDLGDDRQGQDRWQLDSGPHGHATT